MVLEKNCSPRLCPPLPCLPIPGSSRAFPNPVTALNAVRECKRRPPKFISPDPFIHPPIHISTDLWCISGCGGFLKSPAHWRVTIVCQGIRDATHGKQCNQDCASYFPDPCCVGSPYIPQLVDRIVWIEFVTALRVVS